MAGTNIFTHVSDEAKYVYLKPFVSPGKAFQSGGTIQSLLEKLNDNAVKPIPRIPYATSTSRGSVEYATTDQAVALESVALVLTPKTLNDVDEFLSPSTETRLGNLKEILNTELTRDVNASDAQKMMSYRRINDFTTVRRALADDGTVKSSGFAKFSTLNEALSYNPTNFISPLRTWSLIKQEIPNPWTQATETTSGILRTVSPSDGLKSDRNIAISVKGLNYIKATTSKRGAFKLPDSNSRNRSDANEIVVTPASTSILKATTSVRGFFELPTSFTNDASAVTNAALGLSINSKLGQEGGTVTGTLKCDSFISVTVERVRQPTASGRYRYVTQRKARNIFPSNQLDSNIGLAGRPVGSVFHCTSNVDPNEIFGGLWYKIGDARTLIGAGSGYDSKERRYFTADTYGGFASIYLFESHLPEHKHAGWGEAYTAKNGECVRFGIYNSWFGSYDRCIEFATVPVSRFGYLEGSKGSPGAKASDRDNYMYYNEHVGGNKPHENMMPYYAVNIWRRYR